MRTARILPVGACMRVWVNVFSLRLLWDDRSVHGWGNHRRNRLNVLSEDDLELVDALQVNPRASWAAVGAALGRSAVTVARRWNALSAGGAAWTGATVGPDLFRGMFIELGCRPGTVDAVTAALVGMPDVLTVGRTIGEFDLYVIAIAPTGTALSALSDRMSGLDVQRSRMQLYTRVYGGPEWRLRILSRGQTAEVRPASLRPMRRAAVDEADRALFLALSGDARRTFAELADELHSTPQAVRRHVERMRRRGHLHFRTDMARPMAGWPMAGLLWLTVPEQELDAAGMLVGTWPENRFCAAVVSAANLVIIVNLRSPDELQDFVIRLRRKHSTITVLDRRIVLRLDKIHGRVLDSAGRSQRLVPVDPWHAVPAMAQDEPHAEAGQGAPAVVRLTG